MAQLLIEVPAELEEAGSDVPLELPRAQDLGHRARRLPAPQLELEEPVTGGVPALGEEQIMFGLGVDVRDPPAVHEDLDRLVEPGCIQARGSLSRQGRNSQGQAHCREDGRTARRTGNDESHGTSMARQERCLSAYSAGHEQHKMP